MGDAETRIRTRAYATVLVAAGCYTSLTFIWFSLAAYLPPIIDDVGLSSTQAGVLTGAIPLVFIPLGLFMGLTVDRVGAARALAVGLILVGVGQVGRGVSPDFAQLLAWTLLVGVGATLVTFGLPKLVGTIFPPGRLGVPTAIYLVGSAVGSASAFALGRPVLGPALGGWRELFLFSGLGALGYASVWIGACRFAPPSRPGSTDDGPVTLTAVDRDLRVVLTHRDLRLVVVVVTMYLFITHGVEGWLPTILESRGLSPALAGPMTSLYVVSTVAGIVVVPSVADRFTGRRPTLVACGAIGFVGLSGVLVGGIGPVVVVGIVVAGFGAGGLSPLLRAIPPALDDVGARLTGTAIGFAFAVGELGGFGGPLLIGALHDATGSYAPGLAMLVVSALVVVVAGLAMDEV